MPKTEMIHAAIEPELKAKVEKLARQCDVSVSQIVRAALRKWLKEAVS